MSSESRHEAPYRRERTVSSAVSVYLIVLLGLQIFLLTVALDALLGYDPGMAWAAGGSACSWPSALPCSTGPCGDD